MTNKLTPIALFTSPFSFRMIQIFHLDNRLVTLHSVTLTASCLNYDMTLKLSLSIDGSSGKTVVAKYTMV